MTKNKGDPKLKVLLKECDNIKKKVKYINKL